MGAWGVVRGKRVRVLIGVALLLAGRPGSARAAVTVGASRTELLFAAEADPDCSELSKLGDAALPLHVVRLRATVDAPVPADARYQWSLPRPMVGSLAADLDLGPTDQTAAVRGLCADFGNACILTADKLPFYNQPTILWVAPTCAILPTKTPRNFPGDTVTIGVKVTSGKRKVGKANAVIGYGRAATVTLYLDGRDGVGASGGVPTDINPYLGAVVNPKGLTLPPGGEFEFDTGQGGVATVTDCADAQPQGDSNVYDGCTGRLLYSAAGKFIATVREKFSDGSALCDNIIARVLSANIIPRLEVSATPKTQPYVPGDPRRGTVNLKVTLHNDSPRQGGSGILLIGSGVLKCTAAVAVGGTTDEVSTTFDLPHCSGTADQGCRGDADCQPPFCAACQAGEQCLAQSHCSETFASACAGDIDCRAPACPACQDGETCIRVLNLGQPSVVVPIGGQVDLIDTTVSVANQFPSSALIKDTWTVNTFNAGSDDAKLRYRIKGTKP